MYGSGSPTCAVLCVLAYSSNLPLSDYAVAMVLSKWTPDLRIIGIHNGTSEAIPVTCQKWLRQYSDQ